MTNKLMTQRILAPSLQDEVVDLTSPWIQILQPIRTMTWTHLIAWWFLTKTIIEARPDNEIIGEESAEEQRQAVRAYLPGFTKRHSLVRELCSIQQKRGETPKSYYEHLTTIILLLRECHGECIKVKEFNITPKNCFYSGLHEQYQPLVVHLKDKAYMTALDLLKSIRVHEEAKSNLQDCSYYYRPKYDTSNKPCWISLSRKLKDTLPRSHSFPTRTIWPHRTIQHLM